MSISYRIDRSTSTVLYRFDGEATLESAMALSSAVVDDPAYEAGMNGIADLRRMAVGRDVNSDVIRALSEFNSTFADDALGHVKMAIVAEGDLAFGLARMYESYAETLPTDYLVVRDIAEACEWIGVPAEIWEDEEGWKTTG